MSAAEKIRLERGHKIGIIAGNGALPAYVARAAQAQGLDVYVYALDGQADMALLSDFAPEIMRIGAAGKIIQSLKSKNISDIILIGGVRRPSLTELKPDATTLAFLARYGKRALGDDGLLKALRGFLEEKGFSLHGAQAVLPQALCEKGLLTKTAPKDADQADIARGIEILHGLSSYDIGQALIVQQGVVLGVEAAEGTAELIRRCQGYKRDGGGGVLVKYPKDGQDQDLDLPTIGPDTISALASAGFAGIVIKAHATFVVDLPEVVRLANEARMFIEAR